MKRTLFFFLIVLLPITAAAQFTQVSATVTDPNGLAYANGTVVAKLVLPGGTSPTLNGLAYTPPSQPVGLNSVGFFLMQLADNNVLLPAATQWSFTVCSAGGTVQPAGGRGPVCFTAGPITITGAAQSITATLNAAALALSFASGGTINANSGSAGAVAIYPAAGGSTTVGPTPVLTVSGGNTTSTGSWLTPDRGGCAAPVIASATSTNSGYQINSSSTEICSNGAAIDFWDSSGLHMLAPILFTNLLISNTAPTILTHFNTSGDSIAANGTDSITITVGTGVATSTGALTLPAATTAWTCHLENQNRAALVQQTGNTTTSATFTNFGTTFAATNWTNGDLLNGGCTAR